MIKTTFTSIFLGLFLAISAQTVSFTEQIDLLEENSIQLSRLCVVDMNNDQLDDIVQIDLFQLDKIFIHYQRPDGSFRMNEYITGIITNASLWSIGAGDIDNNGFNDLMLGTNDEVIFLLANGDGTQYSLEQKTDDIFSQRSTLSDIDNDGYLDAFICHDQGLSIPYRNDGTGHFSIDYSLIETIDLPGNYSAIWIDYDNDRDQDLYIAKCYSFAGPDDPIRINALYSNNGDGTFTEIAESLDLDDNAQSWTTAIEDFDNDGDLDLFIVNHSDANRFYENNGDGTYTDIILTSGIAEDALGGYEITTIDFNNDGLVDILSDFDDQVYLNNGNLQFTPYDHGLSGNCTIGDLNDDGYMDIYDQDLKVWINDGGDNNWVKLNLVGVESNRNGIGARIELRIGDVTQIKEVRSGVSYSTMRSLTVHFGLNQAESIDEVNIFWPSGIHETFQNVAINDFHTLVEGSGDGIVSSNNPLEETNNLSWIYHRDSRTLDIIGLDQDQEWNYSIFTIDGMQLGAGLLTNHVLEIPQSNPASVYIITLKGESKYFVKRVLIH